MKKAEKSQSIEKLTQQIKNSKSVAVINYQGLGMKDLEAMRSSLAEAGGSFSVVKNTLLKIAFDNAHKPSKDEEKTVQEGLEGPTGAVFAQDDEIAPLQRLAKLIKEKGLPKLKFGLFEGKFITASEVETLSVLPGKNTLYVNLLGSLQGPAYGLVATLNANLQRLVYILDQRSRQIAD